MKLRITAALGLSAAMLLSACAANEETKPAESKPAAGESKPADGESKPADGEKSEEPAKELSGTIDATGASSMQKAQTLWISEYSAQQPGVTVNYTDTGSGTGRENFISGASHFAGTDRAWKAEENVAGAFGNCTKESISYDLPIYISPIAVVYNLPGVDGLNLTPELSAKIFKGEIKKWNDEAIKAENEGLELPDKDITIVHRSDKSGTTGNFTDWMNKAAADAWPEKSDDNWKDAGGAGGDAAEGTSGVITAVKNAEGAIGYADLSQAGDVQKAKINGIEPNSADAAKAVEKSPLEEGRDANDLAIKIDRKAEGYPIVLISYAVVCADYQDDAMAEIVKGYLGYVASDEAQKLAEEKVGIAPISPSLAEKVATAIEAIK